MCAPFKALCAIDSNDDMLNMLRDFSEGHFLQHAAAEAKNLPRDAHAWNMLWFRGLEHFSFEQLVAAVLESALLRSFHAWRRTNPGIQISSLRPYSSLTTAEAKGKGKGKRNSKGNHKLLSVAEQLQAEVQLLAREQAPSLHQVARLSEYWANLAAHERIDQVTRAYSQVTAGRKMGGGIKPSTMSKRTSKPASGGAAAAGNITPPSSPRISPLPPGTPGADGGSPKKSLLTANEQQDVGTFFEDRLDALRQSEGGNTWTAEQFSAFFMELVCTPLGDCPLGSALLDCRRTLLGEVVARMAAAQEVDLLASLGLLDDEDGGGGGGKKKKKRKKKKKKANDQGGGDADQHETGSRVSAAAVQMPAAYWNGAVAAAVGATAAAAAAAEAAKAPADTDGASTSGSNVLVGRDAPGHVLSEVEKSERKREKRRAKIARQRQRKVIKEAAAQKAKADKAEARAQQREARLLRRRQLRSAREVEKCVERLVVAVEEKVKLDRNRRDSERGRRRKQARQARREEEKRKADALSSSSAAAALPCSESLEAREEEEDGEGSATTSDYDANDRRSERSSPSSSRRSSRGGESVHSVSSAQSTTSSVVSFGVSSSASSSNSGMSLSMRPESLAERERLRRILEHEDARRQEDMERRRNQEAVWLQVDAEQRRRVLLATSDGSGGVFSHAEAMERARRVDLARGQEDAERRRRVNQALRARWDADEASLGERRAAQRWAVDAAETERSRRMKEASDAQQQSEAERQRRRNDAMRMIELERARRMRTTASAATAQGQKAAAAAAAAAAASSWGPTPAGADAASARSNAAGGNPSGSASVPSTPTTNKKSSAWAGWGTPNAGEVALAAKASEPQDAGSISVSTSAHNGALPNSSSPSLSGKLGDNASSASTAPFSALSRQDGREGMYRRGVVRTLAVGAAMEVLAETADAEAAEEAKKNIKKKKKKKKKKKTASPLRVCLYGARAINSYLGTAEQLRRIHTEDLDVQVWIGDRASRADFFHICRRLSVQMTARLEEKTAQMRAEWLEEAGRIAKLLQQQEQQQQQWQQQSASPPAGAKPGYDDTDTNPPLTPSQRQELQVALEVAQDRGTSLGEFPWWRGPKTGFTTHDPSSSMTTVVRYPGDDLHPDLVMSCLPEGNAAQYRTVLSPHDVTHCKWSVLGPVVDFTWLRICPSEATVETRDVSLVVPTVRRTGSEDSASFVARLPTRSLRWLDRANLLTLHGSSLENAWRRSKDAHRRQYLAWLQTLGLLAMEPELVSVIEKEEKNYTSNPRANWAEFPAKHAGLAASSQAGKQGKCDDVGAAVVPAAAATITMEASHWMRHQLQSAAADTVPENENPHDATAELLLQEREKRVAIETEIAALREELAALRAKEMAKFE